MQYQAPDQAERDRFHQGTSDNAFRYFGAHPVDENGVARWQFTVWAPNARSVSVTGEFCDWDRFRHPMVKQFDGTWELRLDASLFSVERDPYKYGYPEAAERLTAYKYAVEGADGSVVLKADPFAFQSEKRPNSASRIHSLDGFVWHDAKWMEKRRSWDALHSPVNIYEMHLGTWKRGEDGRVLRYGEIADLLIPYIKDMHYTHVELLPVMEHPLDGSWGYQVTGYYSVTSRYGTPEEFMDFVDRLHQNGIGVILDWVPAHFPRDEFGLRRFDGSPCYEHSDPRRSDMEQWGTVMFDFSRGEVRSFLKSNAAFWAELYHADGLRCDAVSAMLYHDFCRERDKWLPNKYGGHDNLEAISFLQELNTLMYGRFPGIMMIAEESSAWPRVTGKVEDGGLGFGFKWNMGWMNDILSYIKMDPVYRKYHHDKITFSLMYAFSENFILAFSHDEVVHGKQSMLDKNPGDVWRKFAGLRALYGYMAGHPGKKLLFMGGEFGQFIEWKDTDQLDWFLLLYDKHPEMQKYVRDLNRLYLTMPALHKVDDSWEGFMWLSVNDKDRSCVAFMRSAGKSTPVVFVVNFTPVVYKDYRIGLPYNCELTELICSDREEYAGSGLYNGLPILAEDTPCNDLPASACVLLPPLSCVCFTVKKLRPFPKRRQAKVLKGPEASDATIAERVKTEGGVLRGTP